MKKILITGASGFVGAAVNSRLEQEKSYLLLQTSRFDSGSDKLSIDFSLGFNISSELVDVETIIHCAARVHVMSDKAVDSLQAYRQVNTTGTLNLAQQAADAGVKRFIFISTIKVNGESTEPGFPFKPDDNFVPVDSYGLSKYEAEEGLRKIAEKSGMEVVIIRPPLVYGPGVKANFAAMMKWIYKGIPLPLGGINENRRSLVSIDNLVDLIITCIDHPNAANQTFLVSDDDDMSTSKLLARMATALDVPNRMLPVPSAWLTAVAKLMGKPAIAQRLCGSLQVDISKTKKLLDWRPPYSTAQSMKKTAVAYLEKNNK
ncbi:UDP-glucose 4-epimerase family protein [Psychromonas sp.]|uniref:UDP-glucose 4-epimerase family protein n=1 Tax=Psychromonas sp. TaxID=1884585 RepID=UPI0035667BA1